MTVPVLTVTGACSASSFNVSSDYRIKKNIQSLKELPYSVDLLNPVYYFNTKTNKPDIGLIANEVQEHLPFIVNGTKDGVEIQSVNYISIIGLLIHEIKELKTSVENKNDIINSQELQITDILTRLNKAGI